MRFFKLNIILNIFHMILFIIIKRLLVVKLTQN